MPICIHWYDCMVRLALRETEHGHGSNGMARPVSVTMDRSVFEATLIISKTIQSGGQVEDFKSATGKKRLTAGLFHFKPVPFVWAVVLHYDEIDSTKIAVHRNQGWCWITIFIKNTHTHKNVILSWATKSIIGLNTMLTPVTMFLRTPSFKLSGGKNTFW